MGNIFVGFEIDSKTVINVPNLSDQSLDDDESFLKILAVQVSSFCEKMKKTYK